MLVGSHGKTLTANATLPCEDIDVALGKAWGSQGQLHLLNTWEMPQEERGVTQGILHIKSLIINIKAVSGTQEPQTARAPTPRSGETSLSSAWTSPGKKST